MSEESRESPVASHESETEKVTPLAEETSEVFDLEEWVPTAHDLGIELPGDRAEAEALLLRELAEARIEAGQTLESLQRVVAEFDNFRRRVERDHAENIERASQRVIESLLPTLDAFDAALAIEPQSSSEDKILDGMRSTREQLLETLAGDGFEPIPAVGESFDPKVHEALRQAPSEGHEPGTILEVFQKGYLLKDRLLRPALVSVAGAAEADSD